MSGNVWEWSHDGFGNYPEVPTYNPLGGAGDVHALRGGRWGNEPYALRAAKRISLLLIFGTETWISIGHFCSKFTKVGSHI